MDSLNRYYEILGLKPGASEAEVKDAYRKLAKTWHPDRFTDAQLKYKAEEEIKKINEAYQQLKSYQLSRENETSASQIRYSYSSNNAETFYHEGVKKANGARYQEAVEDFTQAIRLNPNYIEAYKYRGLVCEKLGYNHRAKSDLQKALELEWQQKKTDSKSASPTSKPPQTEEYQPRSPASTPATPDSAPSRQSWTCVRTLNGHLDIVTAVAISPDGRIVVSGSADKTVKLWQVSTGQLTHTLRGHLGAVRCIAISRNGKMVASGSSDRTIKLWLTDAGKEIRTLGSRRSGHLGEVSAVAFSSGGDKGAITYEQQ